MREIIIPVLALVVAAAHLPLEITGAIKNDEPALTLHEGEKSKPTVAISAVDVPAKFRSIDFSNIAYPSRVLGMIRLKNGVFERKQGMGGTTVDLRDVHYIDLNNDGDREAIVQLTQVICGGSCDGSSALFYVFSAYRGKPVLWSHIETGSIAYTCGLKSFVLAGGMLTLEAFRKCSFDGVFFKSAYDADSVGGKFVAREFTRFSLRFNGRRFALRKRSLLSNPDQDVRNYPVHISISND